MTLKYILILFYLKHKQHQNIIKTVYENKTSEYENKMQKIWGCKNIIINSIYFKLSGGGDGGIETWNSSKCFL